MSQKDDKIERENLQVNRQKIESGTSKLSDFMSPTLAFFWWLRNNAPQTVYETVLKRSDINQSFDDLMATYEAAQKSYDEDAKKLSKLFD